MSNPPPSDGRPLRGYVLGSLLGEGGFGAVFRAAQPAVQRDVAIKIILPKYANQPTFIRRFESEAQIVARLEHPHIVPLYDFWRDPDGAYIVMRLLRGGSLKLALAQAPWKLKPIVTLMRQLCSAVSFAHQHHIIHQDIKPANILLDEESNAYLSDFGIARNLEAGDSGGGFVGSPNYTAPELIDGFPPSPQSDLYNLGILLYELLAGEHPFQAHRQSPVAMLNAHLNEPLPSLGQTRPDLPTQLEDVLFVATAKDYRERYSSVADFERALWRALQSDSGLLQALDLTPITRPSDIKPYLEAFGGLTPEEEADTDSTRVVELEPPRNPYRGLQAFQQADASLFFGREGLIARLVERLAAGERFITLLGASGSGKSSVARAGLLPALQAGALPLSDKWFTLQVTPGPRPWEEIEAALLSIAVNPPASLLEQLQADERGLARAIKRCLPVDDPEVELVLLIDQFEELFTLMSDAASRDLLLRSLTQAVTEERGRLRLILTLRADFYDRPLQYAEFGALLHRSAVPLLPLTPQELERVIVLPAQQVGLDLETGLLAELLADSQGESGGLPLLQYTLSQLFEARQGQQLTRAAYQALGGVTGALARRADALYADLAPEAQASAQQLFLRLVTLGEGAEDTRRRALQSDLLALHPQAMPAVIEHFGAARLLTFDRDPITRLATVEVAHEALLRVWGQLRDWLARSRDDLRQEARLDGLAQDWRDSQHDPSFLLRGAQLEEAERWSNETALQLAPDVRAFLQASQTQRDQQTQQAAQQQAYQAALEATSRRRLRLIAIIFLIAAISASILSAFAFDQQDQAEADRRIAQTQQGEAQAARQTSDANVRIIQTQVAEAQARADDIQSLSLVASAQRAYLDQEADLAFALALAAVQIPDAPPQAQSALAEFARLPGTRAVIQQDETQWLRLGLSPDSKVLVTAGLTRPQTGQNSQSRLALWNPRTGQVLGGLDIPANAIIVGLAFSPDGSQLFSASSDRYLRIWSLADGQLEREWLAQSDLSSMALSPNGLRVVTGSLTGDLQVYNAQTGQLAANLTQLTGAVNRVGYSSDGRTIIAASSAGQFILWQPNTQVYQDFEADTGSIEALSVTQNQARFLYSTPSGGILYWAYDPANLGQLSLVGVLQEHSSPVTALAVSPDGSRLLSADREGRLLLWDLAGNSVLAELGGHEAVISDVAFSADGLAAVSADVGGQVRLWDVAGQTPPSDLSALIAWVQSERYLRPLTCEERALYLLEACPD
jgi:serine/threonine protein kinase